MGEIADVDCEAGRAMGCGTFCCRLLVRLDPEEREPAEGSTPQKGFVDKSPEDGLCVHLDRETCLCRIWERRPRICREYDCNADLLLQIALREGGCRSITRLAKAAVHACIPRETYRRVPHRQRP
jgi:hypothetical protein